MAAMPFELVNSDHEVTWVRADGEIDTPGKAKAFFAQESGEDFVNIRVSPTCMRDPGPECECGDVATTGLRYHWKSPGPWKTPTSEYMSCASCLKQALAEPLGAAKKAEEITLEEVTPYDGWQMLECSDDAPGAVPYWRREDHQ